MTALRRIRKLEAKPGGSLSRDPTDIECATLAGLQRVAEGNWELLNEADLLACMEKKWVEFSQPSHYRLTEAGRDALSRCAQRKNNPS